MISKMIDPNSHASITLRALTDKLGKRKVHIVFKRRSKGRPMEFFIPESVMEEVMAELTLMKLGGDDVSE